MQGSVAIGADREKIRGIIAAALRERGNMVNVKLKTATTAN